MIEWSLYGHGVRHFVELRFAIHEEACITASIAGFGALTMVLGGVFIGTTHGQGRNVDGVSWAKSRFNSLNLHRFRFVLLRLKPSWCLNRPQDGRRPDPQRRRRRWRTLPHSEGAQNRQFDEYRLPIA